MQSLVHSSSACAVISRIMLHSFNDIFGLVKHKILNIGRYIIKSMLQRSICEKISKPLFKFDNETESIFPLVTYINVIRL